MRLICPLVILIAIVLGCTPKSDSSKPTASAPKTTTESTPARTPEPPKPETGVTQANFQKLKTGMTYADVVEILGAEGELISETDIGGFKTEMYVWKAGFMANMNATFQRGKLVSKAQLGLE